MKHIDKDMFDKQDQWMTSQMQKHIREVNETVYEERTQKDSFWEQQTH